MANVFSTATLGLGVDTSKFTKGMSGVVNLAKTGFEQMRLGAESFESQWKDMTNGIKDTNRIISGILISQGFYTLMNGLTYSATEALTFAQNMETAAVSMEYFVEGADKAAKSLAFLREMNEFAARTPFSTEQALEMSKYIQAVGISMNTSKAFLEVVTDAAAATGATEENLQRVIFALGQMQTKGRIANEEIRQLANANIPIYQILQEELNLTGEQISDIGNYWIDADKAIVAILRGLEKRYDGAADRISDTMSGMLDTIADNTKIIAQAAGQGAYDSVKAAMTNVRDLLDEYREVVTEFGSAGLFNRILTDIDPTGEIGTQVLTLIGNFRQLGTSALELYTVAQPLIGLFGRGLYASISTLTIGVTGFTEVADRAVDTLNALGITSGTTAEVLAQLYIMYKVSRGMISLGQGALYAGQSMISAASGIASVIPATTAASTSVVRLVGTLGLLAAAGVAVYALLGNLNSFAGLEIDSSGMFPSDYTTAMDEYLAAMEEYNAAIEKYQQQFNAPYDAIDDGTDKAVEGIEEVEDASKKAAKAVKNDWVAAFDEVYNVPTPAGLGGGGAGTELPKMPDLGALLKGISFRFPGIGETELKMPEFPWEDVFSGGLLDETALSQDFWRSWLPGVIATSVIGAAITTARKSADKKGKKDISADGSVKAKQTSANIDPKKAQDELTKVQAEQEELLRRIKKNTEEITKNLEYTKLDSYGVDGRPTAGLAGTVEQQKLLIKELKTLNKTAGRYGAILGTKIDTLSGITGDELSLRSAQLLLNKQRLAAIEKELQATGITQGQVALLLEEQSKLQRENLKLAQVAQGADISGLSASELKVLIDEQSNKLVSGFANAVSKPLPTIRGTKPALTEADVRQLFALLDEFVSVGDMLQVMLPAWSSESTTQAERLYNYIASQSKELASIRRALLSGDVPAIEALERFVAATTDANNSPITGIDVRTQYLQLTEPVQDAVARLGSINSFVAQLTDTAIDDAAAEKAEEEARKAAARLAAAADAEKIRLAKETAAAAKRAAAREAAANISYYPTGKQIAGVLDSIGIRRPTEAQALAGIAELDSRGTISQAVRDIKAELKRIDTYSRADLDNIVASLHAIDENILTIRDNGGELNKSLSKHVKALAEQFNVALESAATPISARLNVLNALVDGFQKTLPASGLASSAAQAAAAIELPPNLAKIFGNIENATQTLLSGTTLAKARLGIGAFDGSSVDIIVKAFGSAFPGLKQLTKRDASFTVEIARAMGIYLEPLIAYATAQQWKTANGELLSGGFRAVADGIVQIDTTVKYNGRLISNDIKTVSGAAADAYRQGSTELLGAVRALDASVLKMMRPEHYYQLGMQAVAAGGNRLGMSVFNRDFDVRSISNDLYDAFIKNMQTYVPDGRIFSTDAVQRYNALNPGRYANADTLVEGYVRDVLLPTLGIPVREFEEAINTGAKDLQQFADALRKARLDVVGAATTPYVVQYSSAQLKDLDVANTSKAVKQLNELIAAVAHNDNLPQFLRSFIVFNKDAGELANTVAAIDLNSTLRQYTRMGDSVNKWAQNILKTTDTFDAGAISKKLIGTVDTLVNNYIYDVARLGEADAAALTDKTANELRKLARGARDNMRGATTELFKGTSKTVENMQLFARALDTLADNLSDTNRTAILLRTVTDRVASINASIAAHAKVLPDVQNTFRSLGRNIEELFTLLGMSSNEAAIRLVRQIEQYESLVKQLSSETYFDEIFERIELPFKVASIKENARYTAKIISDAVNNGMLTVADSMVEQFNADLAALLPDASDVTIKFVGDLAAQPLKVPASLFLDFETTDLITATTKGPVLPEVTQISLLDEKLGKVYSWLIDHGERNAEILARMQSIDGVGEAWKAYSVADLANGVTLNDAVSQLADILRRTEGTISGYNAVNLIRSGGGFDARILESLGVDASKRFSDDVMTQASQILSRYTGRMTTLDLSTLYQIATGYVATGAHNAAADVQMTAAIQQAISSGRFEFTVQNAAKTGFEGGIKKALTDSADLIHNMLKDAAGAAPPTSTVEQMIKRAGPLLLPERTPSYEKILEELSEKRKQADTAADTVTEIFKEAAEAGAADTAKRAAAGGADFWGILRGAFRDKRANGLFGSLSDEVSKNIKTLLQRMANAVDSWTDAVKGTKGITSIFDTWDTLVKYSIGGEGNPEALLEGMSKIRAQKAAADWAVEMGAATANTDWVKKAYKAYDDALKQYSKASNAFYKSVTENIAGGLREFKNTDDILSAIKNLSNGTKYLAFTLDPKTGSMKLLGDTLLSSSAEIQAVFKQYAKDFLDSAEIPTDAIDSFFNEIIDAVKKGNLDDLSDGAKTLYKAINTFGQTTVIYDVAEDITDAAARIKYAGASAADTINASADVVAGSFKSIGSRLLNGIGGFGILDILGAGLEGVFQSSRDKEAGKQLQAYLSTNEATSGITNALSAEGINIGEQIGDNIYNAVGQAIGQGLLVGVVGSLAATAGTKIGAAIGTAIAPGIGSAIGAVAGAAIGTIASFATDGFLVATGGKSATNLYLDDYIEQLNTGSVLTEEMLAEAEAALGRALTAEEKAQLEEQTRMYENMRLMGSAKGGFWERDDIGAVLYGGSNKLTDTELALRIATALEAFDTSKIGTYTHRYDNGTVSDPFVTVSDPKVLTQLEKLLGVELELRELAGTTNKVLYDVTNDRYFNSSLDNLAAIEEAIKLRYIQGNSSSAITSELDRIISNNEELTEAAIERIGASTVMAAEALEEYLPIYNEMTGSQLTMDYVNSTMGLGAALVEQMSQMYDAIIAEYLAQAEVRKSDTWNRDIAKDDTSTTIWGANLAGVTQETLAELSRFGITLSETSTVIESELTGAIEQSYITLETSAETIKKNLAGWQIDASNYSKLDLSQITVSAEDAEILASAGIQINGDGTVTFMKAENAGSTGATRDLTLGSPSIAEGLLADLQQQGIALDFSTKSLDLDTSILQNSLTGAMFKLPDNFSSYTSKKVDAALSQIGKKLDSGYLLITDDAILRGEQTLEGYVSGIVNAGSDKNRVNDKVSAALGNIDALIQKEGATVTENIIEWANGIVMPSPIPEDEVTDEIEAAFASMGISFEEYAGQYMMVVNQVGEHLYDGITLVDKEKWYSLDESLRTALEDLGVTVTEAGNQVMVDLSGTFNNGINDVVNLFIAQPEVWGQIPESVRAYLEQAGIISEEGWLVLKNIGEGKLTEIQGAWITLWDGISEETLNTQLRTVDGTTTTLAELRAAVDDGLLKVAGVVSSSEIPQLTENQIAVPFKNLPPEIQAALQSQEGLKGTLEGSNVVLENATQAAFAGMLEELQAASTSAEGTANEMGRAIEDAVVNAMLRIQQLERLSSKLGSTGAGLFGLGGTKNRLGNSKVVGGVTYYPEITADGDIVKYWYFDQNGYERFTYTLPSSHKYAGAMAGKASGGWAAGLTLTGELGREMAILPDGSIEMLGAKGKGELVDLPAGTLVLNNTDTESVLKYAGPNPGLRKLADGNANVTVVPEGEAPTEGTEQQKEDAVTKKVIMDAAQTLSESWALALRGAVAAVTENQAKYFAELDNKLMYKIDGVTKAISDLGSSLRSMSSTMNSYRYQSSNTSNNLSTIDGIINIGNSLANKVNIGSVANAVGGVGNSLVDHVRGSSYGSLVTRDALYRAGEFGLNEAIIPLERPSVMRQVGAAIAAFMPVERMQLAAVAGMRNAGIGTPVYREPVVQQQNVDGIVQRVLEAVLPQVTSGATDDEEYRRPIYVGTLVADEQGLKALERKLYVIRQAESSRR